ncbi:MAG: Holliday junction branch migration protein RuvA [Saprospiraceae bacterium]|nr:Holliday junction branch migration protein RuvA [Saprospiraceae bacterium]
MISYIKGEITWKTPTYIVVETGGIGYHVHISLYTYAQIEKLERVKIHTHLLVREESHTLYGFAEESERSLFQHLISVSGVGPTTAQLLLSAMTPDDIRAAIIGEHEQAFSKVKGIGPKTAKRIILDLKDKMVKTAGDAPLSLLPQDNTTREEALSALVALGFARVQVQKALNAVLKEKPSIKNVEELIKLALRQLS